MEVRGMGLTARIKKSKPMIRLVRPMELTTSDLMYPIFVREDGKNFRIASMEGQYYLSRAREYATWTVRK
jgi:delta-aminolevulinic acid dehydratase/porphobilinogen synthase